MVKREKKKKGETPYEPYIYVITKIKGSMVTAKRMNDEKTKCRDISRFKHLKTDRHPEEKERNQEILVPPTVERQPEEPPQISLEESPQNHHPRNL